MSLLIYLMIFIATFILVNFLLSQAAPFLFNVYRGWQEKRGMRLSRKLDDSFILIQKEKQFFFAIFPFIFAGLGFLLIKNLLGLILGFFLGMASPALLIKLACQQRIKKFRGQLVDSIMILSSCLKAGLSFIQAIEVLCEEMPAPISEEFSLVLRENKLGMTLDESLRLLRKRIPLEEVNLLVSSILVAKETGGELPKVFSRLTETIRDGLKLKEKVTTLTLQGRLQGIIMSLLPVGFTWFIYKQNPHHFDIMFETEMGKLLLGAAVFAQILGMFFIKKISSIKV